MTRRACLNILPDLAEQFGIRPADLDDMRPNEIAYFAGIVEARRKHRG